MNMLDMGLPQLTGEKPRGMDFRDILSIVWRRKWLVFIPLIAALVVGVLLCRFLPKKYTSIAYIHFARPEYTVESPTREALITHQTAFKERARKLEIEATRQDALMAIFEEEGLIDRTRALSLISRIKTFLFGLDPGPNPVVTEQYEDSRDDLLVEIREDQPIIVVQFTTTKRKTAQDVCNKVAQKIFNEDRKGGTILEEQENLYRGQFESAREALGKQKNEIKKLMSQAQENGTSPERLDYMTRGFEAIKADIRNLEEKISRDTTTYAFLSVDMQRLPKIQPPAPVVKTDRADKETADVLARDRYSEFKDYLDRLIKAYGRFHWKVQEQQKILNDLQRKAEIENRKIEQLPIKLPALRAERDRLDKELRDKRAVLAEKAGKRQALEKEIADLKAASQETAAKEEELKQIVEVEEPPLKSEISRTQQDSVKTQKELDEYERLAKLTRYAGDDVLGAGETEGTTEGAAEGEGPMTLVQDDLVSAEMRKTITKLFPGRIPSDLNPEWLKAVVQMASLEVSIRNDKERLRSMEKEKISLENGIGGAFGVQIDLRGMQDTQQDLVAAYDRAQEQYQRAVSQYLLWKRSRGVSAGGRGSAAKETEEADVKRYDATLPLVHSSPRFMLILIGAALAGLTLGGALTVLAEMMDHTVKRPVDLRRVIDRPVLAAIPSLDIGRFHTPENLFFRTKRAVEADLESGILYDRNYVKEIRHRSIATEQIRKLRLNMQTPDGGQVRTILVTSALAGEGKSTVAANLAVAISQMIGDYVLLIDGDLRRPDLHNFFGLPPRPGLAEYLQYDLDLAQLLVKTDYDKLTLLQAGRVPPNSTELLGSDKMRHLVREVKSRYPDRYVVLDSPPVLSTSEPNVLAAQVDGVVLVVRAGMTSREIVEDVLLSLNPEKVIGVVMNDVRTGAGRYYSPSYV